MATPYGNPLRQPLVATLYGNLLQQTPYGNAML